MEDENFSFGLRCKYFFAYHWRGIVSFIVPIVFIPCLIMEPVKPNRCIYNLSLMSIYWLTQCQPLGITALIPVVTYPLMGILKSDETCMSYFPDALFLFFGGRLVGLTIEYSNLHKRVALTLILCIGCSPRRLHFGLLIITMFISMWISNAQATAVMCPIVKAVLEALNSAGMTRLTTGEVPQKPDDPGYPSKSVICYYMGVAFASTIGGCGTLIGTGTNLVLLGIADARFPDQHDIDFRNWMLFNVLPMLLHTILVFIWMEIQYMGLFRPNSKDAQDISVGSDGAILARETIKQQRLEMGPLSCHEVQVGILFLIMVVLFFTSKPASFTGWADFLNAKDIENSLPVMGTVLLLFMLPINYLFMKYWICNKPEKEGRLGSLTAWKFIDPHMPWSIMLMLGGGFSLAKGIHAAGLSKQFQNGFAAFDKLPAVVIQFLCILFTMISTSLTANIAVCSVLIPIIQELAVAVKLHPLYLTLPTTLASSMGFPFPVSSASNAIAGEYGNIRIKSMMAASIGPIIITLFGIFLFSQVWMGIIYPDTKNFPDWANATKPKT